MSTIYVNSNATGLNDGSSWADAYTTLQAALTAWTTADIIFVHVGTTPHNETFAANQTWTCLNATQSSPCLIYGVDKDNSDAALKVQDAGHGGTNIDSTGGNNDLTFDFPVVMHGIHIKSGDDISFPDQHKIHHSKLETGVNSTTGGLYINTNLDDNDLSVYRRCVFNMDYQVRLQGGKVQMLAPEFEAVGSPMFEHDSVNAYTHFHVVGGDFTACAAGTDIYTFDADTDTPGGILLEHCAMPGSWSGALLNGSFTGQDGARLEMYACGVGTDFFHSEVQTRFGTVVTDDAVYEDAGWSDETGNTTGKSLSHRMEPSSAVTEEFPLEGIPLLTYVDSTGSKTVELELIENFTTALQDDELWMDIYHYDTSGQGGWELLSSQVVGGGAANLSAGTGLANWTGEPAGARSVKLSETVTVNNVGLLMVRVYLGKYEADKVVHYDPLVGVS